MSPLPSEPFVQPILDYLRLLSDSSGIIQHGRHGVPDLATGYTTDDNARALIVALGLQPETNTQELAFRYLAFLLRAQLPDGRFHNFVSYERHFLDEVGSEDSQGRALWALGVAAAADAPSGFRRAATEAFRAGVPRLRDFGYLRATAYGLAGLAALGESPMVEEYRSLARTASERLYEAYRYNSAGRWEWFEPFLTYSNATLPKGLFVGHLLTGESKYLGAAERTLGFLIDRTFVRGYFSPPGNKGWWFRNRRSRPVFDQQPVEAGEMVDTCSLAYRMTGRRDYLEAAEKSLRWFYGENRNGLSLYDRETGGCYDGLTPEGLNGNQGAEAVLSLHLAHLAWRRIETAAEIRTA